jgi:hypothetical protein
VASAWARGERVSPFDLIAAFDVDARLSALNERAHHLIDLATERLEMRFPELARQ